MKVGIILLRYLSGIFLFILRILSFGKLPPPLPIASVVIIDKEKILGLKRADGLGISLPGGLIHWNETPEQSVFRETLEETGLKIKLTKQLGTYSFFEKGLLGLNSIYIIYKGEVIGGVLKSSFEGKPNWYKQGSFSDRGASLIIKDLSARKILNVRV